MNNNKIGIIGSGSWATAIALILLEKAESELEWWVRDGHIRQMLIEEGRNPKHLVQARLDTSHAHITADLAQVVASCNTLILAVPSAFIASVLQVLPRNAFEGKNLVSAIKGVVPGSNRTMSQHLNEAFDVPLNRICVISGPTHAEEVCQHRPTFITIASQCPELGQQMADALRCSYVHTSLTDDLGGVEVASVAKNIYAIGAGICQGLGYGDNLKAVAVVNAMKEMVRFINIVHPSTTRNFTHYCFAGDLMVTCWSEYSRNNALGKAVAQGEEVQEVFRRMGSVAEGYYSVANVTDYLSQNNQLDEFPFASAVYRILYCKADPKTEMDYLINNTF